MSLPRALDLAYRALAMGEARCLSSAHEIAHSVFAAETSVLDAARAELARCEAVAQQCFASRIQAQFLRETIAAFDAKQKETPDHAAD